MPLKEFNLMTNNHQKTKRNYISRMINSKAKCMVEAKKYGKNYWDGPRKFGYGGYKYIPGRWKDVAKKLIKKFKLTNNSRILDIGCGKAFMLYEIKKILPKIYIKGFDISKYAIKNAPIEIKVAAKKINEWKIYNDTPGPIPYSHPWEFDNPGNSTIVNNFPSNEPIEMITLIPYGCTTLRISEFPIVR